MEQSGLTDLRRFVREISASDEKALTSSGKNVDRAEELALTILKRAQSVYSTVDVSKPSVVWLFPLIPVLMGQAEEFGDISGPERKVIVLTAIKAVLRIVTPPEYQLLVLPLVDSVIGPLIDASVDAFKLLRVVTKSASKRCSAWCLKKANATAPSTTTIDA